MFFNNTLPAILRASAPAPTRLRAGFRFDDWVQQLGHELGLPGFDMREDEGGLRLSTPLPGWAPEHLALTLDGRILTLKGEKPAPEGSDEGTKPALSFVRRFQLGFDPDPAGLDAELELGVLTVRLPRIPAPDATVIQVRTK